MFYICWHCICNKGKLKKLIQRIHLPQLYQGYPYSSYASFLCILCETSVSWVMDILKFLDMDFTYWGALNLKLLHFPLNFHQIQLSNNLLSKAVACTQDFWPQSVTLTLIRHGRSCILHIVSIWRSFPKVTDRTRFLKRWPLIRKRDLDLKSP